MRVELDTGRIASGIEALARITEPNRPFTRRAFTETHRQGRVWLTEQLVAAGLVPRLDAAGNLVGRRDGRRNDLRPIVLGSHSDTVPHGGRFDGVAGLVAALEVARALRHRRIQLDHPLEVIDFLSEEPSDYGVSCVGSRAASGRLTREMLELKSPSGEALADGIRRVGGEPDRLGQAPRRLHLYLELHIEQDSRLENARMAIGVVSSFAAIRRYRVQVRGQADHAGTTPMHRRQDALVGAAEMVRLTDSLATGNPNYSDLGLVATIGELQVTPGAANAVPGLAQMTLDVRCHSDSVLDSMTQELFARTRSILAQRRLELSVAETSRTAPIACTTWAREILARAALARELPHTQLVSNAGHDATQLAHVSRAGMVFVPSRGGRSHCPEEFTECEDIRAGAEVLLDALLIADATRSHGQDAHLD